MQKKLTGNIRQFAQFYDLAEDNAIAFVEALEKAKLIVLLQQDVSFDITEYRKLFNSKVIGVTGKMGNDSTCSKKMEMFLKEYKVDFETVLKATKYYLDSLNDPRYCIEADNFIFKQDETKTRRSKLLEYCEIVMEGGDKPTTNYTIV